MSNSHYRRAAEHHEQAAHHLREAARHFESGQPGDGGRHAFLAHGHGQLARDHLEKASRLHALQHTQPGNTDELSLAVPERSLR